MTRSGGATTGSGVAHSAAPARLLTAEKSHGSVERQRPPARRCRQTQNHPKRRRLARAVRSKEAGDRPGLQHKRQLGNRRNLAKALRQRLGLHNRRHTTPSSRSRREVLSQTAESTAQTPQCSSSPRARPSSTLQLPRKSATCDLPQGQGQAARARNTPRRVSPGSASPAEPPGSQQKHAT